MNLCFHCDEKIIIPIFSELDQLKKEPFCCLGCLTVFEVINHKGLAEYYEIKKQAAIYKRRSPVENKSFTFDYLDRLEFLNDYSYLNHQQLKTMEFYLEGIHCLACLWLIEKLPEYLADVSSCRLDIQKSKVCVSLNPDGLFSNVARELNNLGYKPHPLKKNQQTKKMQQKEEREMLLRIGIAGAGAGNIMIYAVSNYAGADGKLASIFNLISVIFALPVLFYSAQPFYKNAFHALKNKTLSIDIPISLALIVGAFFGIYNLLMGINENYFDSLTTLVFLLLLSRYFLNKIQEEGLTANDLNFFYEGNAVFKKIDHHFVEIHPTFLKEDDIIKISSNEMIPADGVVIEGETLINNSLLTGESRPINIHPSDQVFSGAINLTHDILIKVQQTKENSRIGKILKEVENGWVLKSPIVDLTNKISKYFVASVFLLTVILFSTLFWQGKTKEALERSIALLIVTCPCALALATPLTLTRTLSRAQKLGIIIKNNEVIEKLSGIKTVFLDKTGTVTYGLLKISSFTIFKEGHIPLLEIIISLEKFSNHPVAIALKEYSLEKGARIVHSVDQYKEHMGIGVSGIIGNQFYQIKNGKIFAGEELIAQFTLEDHLRPDSLKSIEHLKSLGMSIKMISGDDKSVVLPLAETIGLEKHNVYFEMGPESKLSMIANDHNALMVGDGANDAMALSRAYVSVAVLGSLDISLKAADIFLSTPGISHLPNLIIISKETMKVIKRNLVLSLIYNSLSVYAAFIGTISPLVAAIIMPISSLTILASTLVGTKKLNYYLK